MVSGILIKKGPAHWPALFDVSLRGAHMGSVAIPKIGPLNILLGFATLQRERLRSQ
jgi:hypothetical protein